MKKYQAYLFDADGTLFDTAEMVYRCFDYTCTHFGYPAPERTVIFSGMGQTLRAQYETLIGPMPSARFDEMAKVHFDYQSTIYPQYLRLFPMVAETLENLRDRGRRCAIVTSRRKESLIPFLRHTGIERFFDLLVTPEDTRNHKPHPEPVLFAIDKLKIAPGETLFIGDAVFDLLCGSQAGVDTAFVAWSMIEPGTLTIQPTWFIDSLLKLQ